MELEMILRMMTFVQKDIKDRGLKFECDPQAGTVLSTLREMISVAAETRPEGIYKELLIKAFCLADYEIEMIFDDEPEPNEDGPCTVEYEWMMRCSMNVPEETEENAMDHELTRDEIAWLLKNGEFSKGSIEATEAYKNV